jgi:hypothetical protein
MATTNPNNPTSGVPSQTPIFPLSKDQLWAKTKQGLQMEIPGCFYNQFVPTPATVTSGTVTSNGQSLVGALQLGGATATTLPLGGDAAATFSSSGGLLATIATSNFMPTTLNYNMFPVTFVPAAGAVLPTGIVQGVTYYWNWVSATTGNLSATPNGSVIAYTNAGSGTIYCQSAMAVLGPGIGYFGSPWLPAGFLQAAEGLTSIGYGLNSNFPGVSIHYEIQGHKIGTGTNNFAVTPGLISGAGTWTAITATGSALAAVSAGPFPFYITGDIVIQQYGQAAIASPYTAIAMIRCSQLMSVYSAAGTHTEAVNIWAKTVSLDITQQYALDVRYLAATPAIGEYMEPVLVRMLAYN